MALGLIYSTGSQIGFRFWASFSIYDGCLRLLSNSKILVVLLKIWSSSKSGHLGHWDDQESGTLFYLLAPYLQKILGDLIRSLAIYNIYSWVIKLAVNAALLARVMLCLCISYISVLIISELESAHYENCITLNKSEILNTPPFGQFKVGIQSKQYFQDLVVVIGHWHSSHPPCCLAEKHLPDWRTGNLLLWSSKYFFIFLNLINLSWCLFET